MAMKTRMRRTCVLILTVLGLLSVWVGTAAASAVQAQPGSRPDGARRESIQLKIRSQGQNLNATNPTCLPWVRTSTCSAKARVFGRPSSTARGSASVDWLIELTPSASRRSGGSFGHSGWKRLYSSPSESSSWKKVLPRTRGSADQTHRRRARRATPLHLTLSATGGPFETPYVQEQVALHASP